LTRLVKQTYTVSACTSLHDAVCADCTVAQRLPGDACNPCPGGTRHNGTSCAHCPTGSYSFGSSIA